MQPVTPALRGSGFTMVELLIGIAILSILVAVGVPSLSNWLMGNKAAGAAEFYLEGFKLARSQAVMHNGASRLTLSQNAVSGQMDWQVDICFPTAAVPCDDTGGNWSTTSAASSDDREGGAGFKSVLRSAEALPKTDVMAQTLSPVGATGVYFTSLGWVDTNVASRLSRIQMAPVTTGRFPTTVVAITLAGVATKCDPAAAAHDSRGCPP